jgi:hypothetical protein
LSIELQPFHADLKAGRRPKLVLMAPPQHGKSMAAEDLIAWSAGQVPSIKMVARVAGSAMQIMWSLLGKLVAFAIRRWKGRDRMPYVGEGGDRYAF